MGGGSKGEQENEAAEAQADIAEKLWTSTDPLRTQFIGTIGEDLTRYSDPMSIYQTPAYGAAKLYSERAYNQSKDQLMGSTPSGGVLYDKLGDLGESRAGSMTQTLADLWMQQAELSKQRASTAAFGTPGTTMAGLGSASAAEAQQNAAATQSQAAFGQGIGNLAGQLGGSYLLGKMLS
jgi:hypothetical protein